MALKKINESPKPTDTILFEIPTPDATGCFTSNPYKVDRVTIYYVERDFLGVNFGEYTKVVYNEAIEEELKQAEKAYCDSPTAANAFKVNELQESLESSAQRTTFYYKDRVTVKVVGNEGFPAWLSTDTENAMIELVEEDEDGNPQYGHFKYEWNPEGMVREGDYFIRWTWTPLVAGEKLSAHLPFTLVGDPQAVVTIPTHATPEDKYETLLERYLPDMYKQTLADQDITPGVLDLFNQSVAKGFTFVEDMSNQLIDLFDANALHESLLIYLSNLFNVKLKSSDPTLWRRQIKEAVPLFKKKGTLQGLKDAFAQAGMVLNNFTQFWQIVSPYTWTESFLVGDSPSFTLEKGVVLPIDVNNFELALKRSDSETYTTLSKDYVSFTVESDGSVTMTWIGDELSASPVDLFEGDRLKVKYQYEDIPGPTEQALEDYVQLLPLADQRSEDDQEYPPKNWNVRLIDEGDPLFATLVPAKHPFHDWLIFGHVRTEFGYSENIYNMEEYNGSTRPSFDPCFIDKNFRDPCGACISSKYSVDVGIEELSNDRMLEAQDILREYTPFHAQLHSLNFTGEVNEFVQSPVESIDYLVTIDKAQYVLSGQSNPFFHRIMEGGLSDWIVTRDDLTDQVTVLSGKLGTAYNESVALVTPDITLKDLGVIDSSHILEVLAPSLNAGTYLINDISGNVARVATPVSEPLDQSAFTFNLSNVIYGSSIATITQDDLFKFSDMAIDFAELGVKTLWDVEHTPDYTGGSWKVLIPAYSATAYLIDDIVDGVLHLDGDGLLPVVATTGISYTLLNDDDEVVDTSTTGSLAVSRRAYVNLHDPFLDPIEQFIKAGDYLHYDGNEYMITAFDGLNFWISDYADGDVGGATIQTRRRLVRNQVGYFNYRGLRLITFSDHESEFAMVNGENQPPESEITDDSRFKENFMFLINGEFYKIVSINADQVVLTGRDQNWTTLAAGGTVVAYSLVHFPKNEVNVGFTVFDHLDRDGQDPVVREIESTVDSNVAIVALSTSGGSGVQENLAQEEGITFIIENAEGETYEGEI